MNFEIDVLWAKAGGVDPAALIEKLAGRVPLTHLKDMRKGTKYTPPVASLPGDTDVVARHGRAGLPRDPEGLREGGRRDPLPGGRAPRLDRAAPAEPGLPAQDRGLSGDGDTWSRVCSSCATAPPRTAPRTASRARPTSSSRPKGARRPRAWRGGCPTTRCARSTRARCGATMDTAAILAAPHGLAPVTRDGLREISHGRWEGLRRADVEERFPEEYAAWEEDPFTFAPEGGESGLDVMARALPVIREIVVAHHGPKRDRGLPQGHAAPRDQQPARLRRARLPRPARPVAGLPERDRLQGPGPRAPDAVQRRVALRRPPGPSAAPTCRSGGTPLRRQALRPDPSAPTLASAGRALQLAAALARSGSSSAASSRAASSERGRAPGRAERR